MKESTYIVIVMATNRGQIMPCKCLGESVDGGNTHIVV